MINLQITGFDWDDGNREKCYKHGLNQNQIEHFFHQKELFVGPDPNHSKEEERFLAVGQSRNERPLFVVFTIRRINDEVLIRPISARFMHEKEAKKYEEESAKLKER
jgi:uncharacterized DUF497 family protein